VRPARPSLHPDRREPPRTGPRASRPYSCRTPRPGHRAPPGCRRCEASADDAARSSRGSRGSPQWEIRQSRRPPRPPLEAGSPKLARDRRPSAALARSDAEPVYRSRAQPSRARRARSAPPAPALRPNRSPTGRGCRIRPRRVAAPLPRAARRRHRRYRSPGRRPEIETGQSLWCPDRRTARLALFHSGVRSPAPAPGLRRNYR
jgi:hypothetical protein